METRPPTPNPDDVLSVNGLQPETPIISTPTIKMQRPFLVSSFPAWMETTNWVGP
jgi:hypothetical protein